MLMNSKTTSVLGESYQVRELEDYVVKMASLLKFIYMFNAIPSIISNIFYRHQQVYSKIYTAWKMP